MSNNFVDFEVYKKSVQLTKGIYMLLSNPVFIRESAFSNQLKRAVLSITNNIAEGSEYNSNNQFIRYLKIAKGSCAEVRNMLMLANELNFANIDIKRNDKSKYRNFSAAFKFYKLFRSK